MLSLILKHLIGLHDMLQSGPVGDETAGIQLPFGDQLHDPSAVRGVHAAGLKDQILSVHVRKG